MGGQWSARKHGEANVALGQTPGNSSRAARLAERHRVLESMGFVPAVAERASDDPRSTARRAQWWETHFVNAEYGAANPIGGQGGYAQMPDDYTPSMTGGQALSGARRTHRMNYSGAEVSLRMPSATAIKRFEKNHGQTFDVPVSAVNEHGGSISGWVRVTRSGKDWTTSGQGFSENADAQVAEAVSAVLEARRPTRALSEVGDLIGRHKARRAAQGTEMRPVASSWIDTAGYDEDAGMMVMTTGGRQYGYSVPKSAFLDMTTSTAPGRVFNAEIKGKAQRVEVTRCEKCGRFSSAANSHSCPGGHQPAPAVAPLHSRVARQAAMRATSAYAASQDRSVTPAQAPGPSAMMNAVPINTDLVAPVKKVDMTALLHAAATQRQGPGERWYAAPRGWTVDASASLAHLTDSAHVPHAYSEPIEYEFEGQPRTFGGSTNGSLGLINYAGAGADEAAALRRSIPAEALDDRQNEGPTLRSILDAADRHPGEVEFGGYVVGPDRPDERITSETVYLFGQEPINDRMAWTRLRDRLDASAYPADQPLAEPDEIDLVDVPWRPGEKAWRMWWD